LKEFSFIDLLKPSSLPPPEGIGDDAAVLGDLLIATDIMVEGTHFLASDLKDADSVWYMLQHLFISNISDIAAMGGKNGDYKALLGVAVRENCDKQAIAAAILDLCKRYDVRIIGGDTVTTQSGAFFAMTIIGRKNDKLLTRAGARVGDVVFVSRPLGASEHNLQWKLKADPEPYYYQVAAEPALGELLGSIGGVTACLDISDGLGRDLSHISSASGVKIVLEHDKIPIADILISEEEKLEFAISSGEEYALAFTVAPERAASVAHAALQARGRKIHYIGKVESGSGCWLRGADGKLIDISQMGYEHR
jgi:thiamine-monophosphate kinase